jgi:hypothetical protein
VFPTYFRHLNNFDFQWSAEEKAAIIDGEKKRRAANIEEIRDDDKY